MNQYQKYLEQPKSLTLEEMREIYDEMILAVEQDSDAQELYQDLIKAATDYAKIRAEWGLFSKEEKMDNDHMRTGYHNSVITHFNMLSRCLKMKGIPHTFRDKLGYEEDDAYNRKTIGDFACFVVFLQSIMER